LHDLEFRLSELAYNTLLLDVGIHLSMPKDHLFKMYSESITVLNTFQYSLNDDYNHLASCHNSKIFYNPEILVYNDFQADYYRDSLAGILKNTIANVRCS
jgi:hypothetical protein